jgi:small nuclear ribonucleoprotein (snRNP)-like protein
MLCVLFAIACCFFPPTMKLICFLMKLNNKTVTLELKNGSVILGTITGVSTAFFFAVKTNNNSGMDMQMNTYFKLVKITAHNRNPMSHDSMSIRRNAICYFVLLDALPLDTVCRVFHHLTANLTQLGPAPHRQRTQTKRPQEGA